MDERRASNDTDVVAERHHSPDRFTVQLRRDWVRYRALAELRHPSPSRRESAAQLLEALRIREGRR